MSVCGKGDVMKGKALRGVLAAVFSVMLVGGLIPLLAYAQTYENGASGANLSAGGLTTMQESPDPDETPDIESPADKRALEKAIAAAQSAKKGVKTSADGKDVAPADKWVTPAVKKALDDAIAAAQAVAEKDGATQDEVDAAKAALEKATRDFKAAKKSGTKPATVAIASVTAKGVVYAGKAWPPKPALTVKDVNGKAVPASGYTATYAWSTGYKKQLAKNGKYVGAAKVTVKGKGSYAGTKSASFKVTTVADTKTAGAKLTEKTLGAIEKLKEGASKVPQANSKTMETIAKPRAKTMTVKWKAVKGATNYVVGYKRSTAKEWSYEMSGGKTEHTFKNMKEGDLMEFRVGVYDGKKFARSEWTQINCRFYREMVSLKAAVGKGKVDLSWGKVTGATGYQVLVAGYQVLVASKSDMSDKVVVDVSNGSTLKKTIKTFKGKALKSGKTYYIKVRPAKSATNVNGKKNTYIGIQSLVRKCTIK